MRQVVRSEVGEQVKRLEARVASIESTLSAQVSNHDVVQQQLTDISKDLSDLKDMKLADRVNKLELDIASLNNRSPASVTPSPSGFQFETIMSEMRERQRRANNLIFYNVPESTRYWIYGCSDRRRDCLFKGSINKVECRFSRYCVEDFANW